MLRAFLALDRIRADQFADRVAAFVRQWGPLRLCEAHGLPFSHTVARRGDPCPVRSLIESTSGPGTIKGLVVRGKCEAVRLWGPYIRVAATLVRLSGRLHEAEHQRIGWPWGDDEAGRVEWERDWRLVLHQTAEWRRADVSQAETRGAEWSRRWPLDPRRAMDSKWQRAHLLFEHWRTISEMIDPWLRWADVRPSLLVRRSFRDDDRVPSAPIELVDDGYLTFGALALQLAAALTGSGERLVRCSGQGPRCEGQFVTDHPIRKYCNHCRSDNIGGKKSSAHYYRAHAAAVRAKRRHRYRKQTKRP